MLREKRGSLRWAILLRICQAMTIPITTVFPVPVAILQHSLVNSPPSPGTLMPTLSESGPSTSQIKVSTASNWQKNNRRSSTPSRLFQCSSRRRVTPVTPGYPALRQAATRGRMRFTNAIS